MPDGDLTTSQWMKSGEPGEDRDDVGSEGPDDFPLELATLGEVRDDDVDYATERLSDVIAHINEPILSVRLKLVRLAEPARDRPARIQATIDVNGDIVRSDVGARDLREAADGVKERLLSRLRRRMSRLNDYRSSEDQRDPGECRHGDMPTQRADFFDRPMEERALIRHKTFAPDEMTPDEAVFDMDQLDFDFYLFTELATGRDAVMERLGDGTYRLHRLRADDTDPGPTRVELTVTETSTPELPTAEALSLLDESGERFVFFADPAVDRGARGRIVYRRYDGHYGLITTA